MYLIRILFTRITSIAVNKWSTNPQRCLKHILRVLFSIHDNPDPTPKSMVQSISITDPQNKIKVMKKLLLNMIP